jgi:hypothetical protein
VACVEHLRNPIQAARGRRAVCPGPRNVPHRQCRTGPRPRA